MRRYHHARHTSRDPDSSRRPGGKETAIAVGAVAVGAAATGFLVGRLNHWNIPKTPIPWGVAIGGTLATAGVLGWLPSRWTMPAILVGAGSIATWPAMLGAGTGQQSRAAAGEAITPITAGPTTRRFDDRRTTALPARPRRLGEWEIASMMHGR